MKRRELVLFLAGAMVSARAHSRAAEGDAGDRLPQRWIG